MLRFAVNHKNSFYIITHPVTGVCLENESSPKISGELFVCLIVDC